MTLPQGWSLVPLDKIAAPEKGAIRRGPFGGSIKKEIFVADGYKVYEQQNAIESNFDIGRYFIDEQKYKEMEGFSVKPDDLIISCAGTIGRVAIAPSNAKSGIINQALMRIRPDISVILPRYLKWFLESPLAQREIFGQVSGTALKNLAAISEIKKCLIPLPPIAEQRRIAAILDRADAVRRKRQEAIALTEELLRSAFLEMFGDPVTNPKSWEMKTLGSLCTIVRGGSPRPINEYLGGTVPWIKIGDGTDGDDIYISKTAEAIKPEGVKKSRYLEPGSLIFANCGVSLGFARILRIGGCIHDGWLAFSDINPSLNKIYLLKLLNSITNHFRAIAPDGTQPNLNTSIMKEFCIPTPPLDLQEQFAELTEKLISSKERFTGANKESDNFFNSLLQRAFRGEL